MIHVVLAMEDLKDVEEKRSISQITTKLDDEQKREDIVISSLHDSAVKEKSLEEEQTKTTKKKKKKKKGPSATKNNEFDVSLLNNFSDPQLRHEAYGKLQGNAPWVHFQGKFEDADQITYDNFIKDKLKFYDLSLYPIKMKIGC